MTLKNINDHNAMNLRYIALDCQIDYPTKEFSKKFRANTNFIQDYLSKQVRKLQLDVSDDFNMVCVKVSQEDCSVNVVPDRSLLVTLHVSEDELMQYDQMLNDKERYDYLLSILERGYLLASSKYSIPVDQLMNLHAAFKSNDYTNQWVVKALRLKGSSITIAFIAAFTHSNFSLNVRVVNKQTNEVLANGTIFKTDPYWVCFEKDISNIHIEGNVIVIEDFQNNVNVVINVSDLLKGEISISYSPKFSRWLAQYENTIKSLA